MGAFASALREALRRSDPQPRGVTVFDGENAQEYPSADEWRIDDKGALHLSTPDRRSVATYVVATWLRVVAGIKPPPETSPQ